MKKGIFIGALIAIFVGVIFFFGIKNNGQGNVVSDPDSINPASEETGLIGEKVIGDPEKASVVLYEYADFGCTHCADWNRTINGLFDKYGEKLALVFRYYSIGSQNGPTAARAATAAQLQGYFKEYKDLLFNNQSEWFYETGDSLSELLVQYFNEASNNKGDVNKFKKDLDSGAVKKRLNFESEMAKAIDIKATPTFRINGEKVEAKDLVETIESKI